MKRLLAFIAIFAAGLALLLWIERRTSPPSEPAPPTPAPTPAPQQEKPLTEFTDAQGRKVLSDFSGPLDARYKPLDTGRLRYQITSTNVTLAGEGVIELAALKASFYDDRGDGELESEATATRARAKLDTANIDRPIDENYPITLFDTEATLHKGSRFAPVTLRVPQLEGTFATRHFTSKDQVDVSGRGLTATGRGLELDGALETMSLLEDPRATVEFESGSVARVASHGAFTVTSRPDLGPDAVEIDARDQATLKLEGKRQLELRADVVRLFGNLERGAERRFVPTHAEAEGHVVAVPSEGTFAGDRAVVEFVDGEPAKAALDGHPQLDLVLRGERLERIPSELLVEGETLTVALRGAGPLELFLGDEERFEFTGPVTLELPAVGAKLTATSSINGARGADGRFHELAAIGNATFDYEEMHVDAQDLLVRAFNDEQGRAAARVIGVGSTHVTGTLEDGRPVDLLARQGLIGERRREGLRVVSADDVELTVRAKADGPIALHATADHVRDADLAALTLIAEGNVEFQNERGRGRGTQLAVSGPSRGELSGDELRPARFDFDEGYFEARYIDFDGVRVQARIDAHASADVGGTHYDIEARWVAIERHEAPTPGVQPQLEDDVTKPGVVLLAGGETRSVITNGKETWRLSADELRAFSDETRDERGASQFEPTGLVARGLVDFDYVGAARITGKGDRLEVTPDRRGHLYPLPDQKVALNGALPGTEIAFDLLADSVEFSPTELSASGFDITVLGLDVPWQEPDTTVAERSIRAIGDTLAADENSITLTDAYLGGKTATRGDWSFDAPFVLLTGSARDAEQGAELEAVRDLVAWGGFTAQLGQIGFARGESIQLINERRTATISGAPATLVRPEMYWSSPWFDIDLDTGYLRTEGGEINSAGDETQAAWTLRYSSLEPVVTPDETIQVMRDPVMTQGSTEIRAGWAVAWLDRGEWSAMTGAAQKDKSTAPAPQPRKEPRSLFGQSAVGELSRWLREIYLENEIEFRVDGERRARASSAYFDLVDGNGWLHDVDIKVDVHLSSRSDSLEVKADTLRHSQDGSLHAVDAVVTACTFDVPHYVIKIGTFAMAPRWREETLPPKREGEKPRTIRKHDGWDFALEGNKIASAGGVAVPMPPIAFPTNPKFEVDPNALAVAGVNLPSFGQDSKFGTFISASFTSDLGWVGKKFHSLIDWIAQGFGAPKLPKVEGRTKYTGSYYGSRGGGRGGIESKFDSPGKYRFDVLFDLIYDEGEDHGLVRVPEDDRDVWRAWLRTRGRYLLGDREWLDLVLTYQTDPGVQAEFFESEFLRYEERETYVHYRKVVGERQWNATLEARLDDFRTEVTDQPSLGYFRGRSQITSLGGFPLIYASNSNLEHLARYEGKDINSMTGQPYEPPFADGLGERDVTRFDTTQRLETPLDLQVAGMRATPFVAARATGWSDNAAQDDTAARAALLAGAEVATTFWRLFSSGSRHSLTPSVGYHADVASTDTGQPVAQFDSVDAPIDGQFVDLAVRSRWEYRELKSDLDIELRETWANDLPTGQTEGWQPLITRATWLTRAFGMPVGLTHDAHYDLEADETDYSRTFVGWEPRQDLDFSTGYQSGRSLAGDRIFDALSLGAHYALSSKWEIDGDYTFSISDNGERLGSSLTLRRIGHDFVFEIESSFVAGEGASSLRFHITPLITWHPDDDTMIKQWLALRQ